MGHISESFVGRGLFSSKPLGKLCAAIENGEAPPDYIFGDEGDVRISVDLLRGSCREMTEIGIANAKNRGPDRNFHGWVKFPWRVAQAHGRKVVPSPREEPPANPYHADIVLPSAALPDTARDLDTVMKERAKLVADLAGNIQLMHPCGSQNEDGNNGQ